MKKYKKLNEDKLGIIKLNISLLKADNPSISISDIEEELLDAGANTYPTDSGGDILNNGSIPQGEIIMNITDIDLDTVINICNDFGIDFYEYQYNEDNSFEENYNDINPLDENKLNLHMKIQNRNKRNPFNRINEDELTGHEFENDPSFDDDYPKFNDDEGDYPPFDDDDDYPKLHDDEEDYPPYDDEDDYPPFEDNGEDYPPYDDGEDYPPYDDEDDYPPYDSIDENELYDFEECYEKKKGCCPPRKMVNLHEALNTNSEKNSNKSLNIHEKVMSKVKAFNMKSIVENLG